MPKFVNRPGLCLTKALSTLATIVPNIDTTVAVLGLYSLKMVTIVAEMDHSLKCGEG